MTSSSSLPIKSKGRPESVLDRHSQEYVFGAIASLVNISITFPINKLMFRQQVHGIRFFRAVRQLKNEGALYIYRGLLPPLLQRSISVSLMFGTYFTYYDLIEGATSLPHIGTHTLAALGAGTTEALLAPFERIQAVLQVNTFHSEVQNSLHAFRVVSGYGIRELYRGLSAILLRNGPSNVLFLGLRDPLRRSLPQPQTEIGHTINAFISGAGLGASLSTLFFPLNVVKTKMQARIGGPFLGIRETTLLILEERGYKWKKMYRGVHLNYTRSFLSWGIINAVYELLLIHFSKNHKS